MRNPKAVDCAKRTLSANMRRMRHALGLTLHDAGARAGLHWRHFQRVEAGQVNATHATLIGVAAALENTIPVLFTERRLS